jgi:hypothetical protein
MDGSASPTPQQCIAAECASRGRVALTAGCIALLNGRPGDVDDHLIAALGGEAAGHVLDGGEGGRSGYWPRVWAARGLLHAWDDDHTAKTEATETAAETEAAETEAAETEAAETEAEVDAATDAIIGALGDHAWRVREMAAKVVARHRVGRALDAIAALRMDPVPRVRAAAERAVVLLTVSQA